MSIYKSGAVGMSAALAEQLRGTAAFESGRAKVTDQDGVWQIPTPPDVGDNPYIRNAMLSNLHQNISAAAYAYRCGVLVSCLVIDTWSQKLQNPGVLHKTVLAKAISIHNELHPHPILRGAKS